MKPLKMKTKKLSIKKETLRTLTDSDLSRANGRGPNPHTTDWCSTFGGQKCGPTGKFACGFGTDYC